jgi:hypothetical protein
MKGKNKVNFMGREGLVSLGEAPDYGFLYETSLVKDPKWNIGDVVELPNGKGFVYCKSSGACYTGQGNSLFNAIPATGIDYAANVATAAIGDMSVVVTNGATVAQTEDGLKGGTIILNHSGTEDNSDLQMRTIIGNTAGAINIAITVYLDAPLTGALVTGTSCAFCMPSPYSSVKAGDLPGCSKVGIAATYVSVANTYHWEQFKGRCWLPPSTNSLGIPGKVAHARGLVWRSDGSVQIPGDAVGVNGLSQQVAGYILDNNAALNGSTEVMLTGNV